MSTHFIEPGATSQCLAITVRSSTTGQPLTGLAYGSVVLKTQVAGAATATTQTLAAGTLGSFVSNGWIETQIAGTYQYCPPNALLASTAEIKVVVTATGAIAAAETLIVAQLPVNTKQIAGQTVNACGTPGGLAQVDGFGRVQANVASWNGMNVSNGDNGPNVNVCWWNDNSVSSESIYDYNLGYNISMPIVSVRGWMGNSANNSSMNVNVTSWNGYTQYGNRPYVDANVQSWNGYNVYGYGEINANVTSWSGYSVSGNYGMPNVNVSNWSGNSVYSDNFYDNNYGYVNMPAVSVRGWVGNSANNSSMNVNVTQWNGSSVSGYGTPYVYLSGGVYVSGGTIDYVSNGVRVNGGYVDYVDGSVYVNGGTIDTVNNTINANVQYWNGSSASSAIVNSNVAYWNGTSAGTTIVNANVANWMGTSASTATINANVIGWMGGSPSTAVVNANVTTWNGTSAATVLLNSNVIKWNSSNVSSSGNGFPNINVTSWGGTNVSTHNGYPSISVQDWNAGTVDANIKKINGALTDGSPAVGSRPALYLESLDIRPAANNAITLTTVGNGGYAGIRVDGGGGIYVQTNGNALLLGSVRTPALTLQTDAYDVPALSILNDNAGNGAGNGPGMAPIAIYSPQTVDYPGAVFLWPGPGGSQDGYYIDTQTTTYDLGYTPSYDGTTLKLGLWVRVNGKTVAADQITDCALKDLAGNIVAAFDDTAFTEPQTLFTYTMAVALTAHTCYVLDCVAHVGASPSSSGVAIPLRVGIVRP